MVMSRAASSSGSSIVSGGQILTTFSWWPPEPSRTPRSNAARRIAPLRGASGVRVRPVRDDLDPGEQTEPADLADVRLVGERVPQPVEHPPPEGR